MTTKTSAPAKVILFGEHAVVYGQPAIAVPISSLRAYAEIEPSERFHILAKDTRETLPIDISRETVDNALTLMARNTLAFFDAQPPNVTITLSSQIPLARGLGSGAAVSAALGRAIAAALQLTISDSDLNDLVYTVEQFHHGTPSGIDNTVIVFEQPVFFVRDKPIERLELRQPFYLIIADTGQAALTRVAVGDVRKLVQGDPERFETVIASIGRIAEQARLHLKGGKTAALGPLMIENHRLLQQLTVSSSELDHLVRTAIDHGALGAKLSGGGRGGNMIALVTELSVEPVSDALRHVGASHVFSTLIE